MGSPFVVIPFWFICKKAGFSPWLSLLNIIPLGNLILIYVLAFAEWKVVPVPQMAGSRPCRSRLLPPQSLRPEATGQRCDSIVNRKQISHDA